MAYFNSDGLLLKYGTERGLPTQGGEYKTYGRLHEIEIQIDMTKLTDPTETIQSDVTILPSGVIIQEVEIDVKTAAATGVAIDIGLTRLDRATELDYDGIVAALATASIAAGKKIVITNGSTSAGALIGGSALANPAYISASRTTATAFTAGYIVVTIRYWKP
jgi:hypothetical protein